MSDRRVWRRAGKGGTGGLERLPGALLSAALVLLCLVSTPSVAQRNEALGLGEAPEPQPFTREQRLLEAARQGDRATVERALELGVSVHARDDLGRSVLLLAVRDAGDLELVRFLQERGARLDEADLAERTPLSFAAQAGRLPLVRYLVEGGARVDARDRRQRTPLFYAALGNHVEVARYLLEHGAVVDAADTFADTPLLAACAKGHGEMAQLLRARGADPTRRDQEGRSAAERSPPGVPGCGPDPTS